MPLSDRLVLWVALGFGAGKAPVAPGTFGSLVGILWFLLLVSVSGGWGFVVGAILGAAASVWICGRAEQMLGTTDPGCVVFDEIAAIPLCFAGWIGMHLAAGGEFPGWLAFCGRETWLYTGGVFLLFRIFDVVKPWPVRSSQNLPGGWGVAVDDLLAAVYVNGVVLALAATGVWPKQLPG
jgi:phosphatidylglycerophosphatase A